MTPALLSAERVSVHRTRAGAPPLQVLHDVTLRVNANETVAIVGESGSGKSTLARAIVRLLPLQGGRMVFGGTDLATVSARALRALRREFQLVFQDSALALNPLMQVNDVIGEGLDIHRLARGAERMARIHAAMAELELDTQLGARLPPELSGGQRQRVALARALVVEPRLLILDEPLASLDANLQAHTLKLLDRLRRSRGLGVVLISHDISAVAAVADRVVVMLLGRVIEAGAAVDVLGAPRHPYTRALLAAVPRRTPQRAATLAEASGDVGNLESPPAGCRFHPRCPVAIARCAREAPALVQIGTHAAACHLVDGRPAA